MILDPNEIFFTSFEPKLANRFVMYIDGIPSYLIKSVNGIGYEQGEIQLNHINTYRKVKSGRLVWNDVSISLWDPITPSGAQAVMEWTRLHHESVTGRSGYSDMYKKDLSLNILGPVGDVVSETILKGAFIKSANLGDYSWDDESAAISLELTLGVDYVVLNY
jgi:hypothetical protein